MPASSNSRVGGEQGGFGGEHLGLGHRDRGGGHAPRRGGERRFDGVGRQVEHGFRGTHADAQVADLLDGVGVFPGMLLVGVYPWPRVAAHLLHGLGEDATGDAGVDGGLDELRYGAGGGGRSKARCTGMTCSAGTRTLSRMTVPLAVVRWPKPDQSSITVSPGASRG